MLTMRRNFLGLSPGLSGLESSRYVILPVPYEETVTFGEGTEFGPNAILNASQEVELYDDELGLEACTAGIHTALPVAITSAGPETQNELIYRAVSGLLAQEKIVGVIGGEHSISYGSVKACLERYPRLTVLQLDAHADLRDGYLGQRYSHASVMRRIRDLTDRTIGVGVRNFSAEESEYIRTHEVPIISAYTIAQTVNWVDEVVRQVDGDLYITFDVDSLDPSLMPATGTPEPGGLLWYPTLELLRRVIGKCHLVGFDVVELAPILGFHSPDFLVAKLIYKIIGYDVARRRV